MLTIAKIEDDHTLKIILNSKNSKNDMHLGYSRLIATNIDVRVSKYWSWSIKFKLGGRKNSPKTRHEDQPWVH